MHVTCLQKKKNRPVRNKHQGRNRQQWKVPTNLEKGNAKVDRLIVVNRMRNACGRVEPNEVTVQRDKAQRECATSLIEHLRRDAKMDHGRISRRESVKYTSEDFIDFRSFHFEPYVYLGFHRDGACQYFNSIYPQRRTTLEQMWAGSRPIIPLMWATTFEKELHPCKIDLAPPIEIVETRMQRKKTEISLPIGWDVQTKELSI